MTARMAADTSIGLASDFARPARARGRWPADGPPGIEALIVSGNPMNGTSSDDFMFGVLDGPDHTINGNSSNDLVLGDMSALDTASRTMNNNALISALSLETPQIWTTDENPLFGDFSIPHATAFVLATAGQEEFYSLTIGAGETITIDIDYGSSNIGTFVDTAIELLDAGGNVLASNASASASDGGFGSQYTSDPFLNFTVGATGSYFIRVRETDSSSTFEGDEDFLLNVSVTGHAVTSPTPQGDDVIDGGSSSDELFGGGGDDTISASSFFNASGNTGDLLHGGSGADLLNGGPEQDTLFGGDGVDTVNGGSANDEIRISNGEFIDFVDGGADLDKLNLSAISGAGQAVSIDLGTGVFSGLGGPTTIANIERVFGTQLNDTLVSGDVEDVTLDGGLGDDRLDGGDDYQALFGGQGDDTIVGNASASMFPDGDSLEGGAGDDLIVGSNGRDIIDGDQHDDSLAGIGGDDSINGGDGLDSLEGGDGADTLLGGDGVDLANGGLGADSLLGDAGEDSLLGGDDGDTIRGGLDFDALFGDAGDDLLAGEDGADTLTGGGGNDSLDGGIGKDSMLGGNGVDVLFGGDANDTLIGGGDGDVLNGGNEIDWADYSGSGGKVVADLRTPGANTNDAAGDSYTLIENLRGTAQGDTLSGDLQSNRIEGIGGNDSIAGRSGDDTLAGGVGKDKLRGGEEADDFELASIAAADADTILDFASGADRIALVGAVYGLPLGALDPTRFVVGGQAQDANDRLIYKAGQGKLYFDPDGDGAQAQVLIATLSGAPALSAADFVVT
ncbi:MAG: pre-peptidase C-terminal domain-containing protein [Sphingomonadaceae bacterium]|nr:pre-peptidase C-terminal domain-containing protein [Sphingomonadaceae bacterium]